MTADLRSTHERLLTEAAGVVLPDVLAKLVDEVRAEVSADALRVPTEHLCDSPQGRTVTRRRMRMLMAFDLFTAKHTGSLTFNGNTTDLRAWCWQQADKFIGEADNPPLTPAPRPPTTSAAAATPPPPFDALPADHRTYLTWLAGSGDEGVPPSAHCPAMGPERSSVARRLLHKAGLIETCSREDGCGFRVSEAGKDVLRVKQDESREMAA